MFVCPYHDWRKIEKEGFRTRDAHIIEELTRNNNVRVVVINRPTTFLEIALKKKPVRIKGELLFKSRAAKLIAVSERLWVVDLVSFDWVGQVMGKYCWVVNRFINLGYINIFRWILAERNEGVGLLSFNIFAFKLFSLPFWHSRVFDAWDNFFLFPNMAKFKNLISTSYTSYASLGARWTTNSLANAEYFSKHYGVQDVQLISNGVSPEKFMNLKPLSILNRIPKPIVGFGGKFTHLVDVDLVNFVIQQNPKVSFVFVGQILDRSIFKRIVHRPNFFYLGDLHYNDYIKVVPMFDVGILPYVVADKETGADSIKLYEYLAAGIPVVSSESSGAVALKEHIFLSSTYESFSQNIQIALSGERNGILPFDPTPYSWSSKSKQFLNILSQ